MTRYFFNVTGSKSYVDRDGVDLANDAMAWGMAVSSGGELLRDLGGRLPNRLAMTVRVSDESGRAIATLRLAGRRRRPAQARKASDD